MALKAGVPIVPAGINGNYKIFSKVTITYGEPIYYDKSKINPQDKEKLDELTIELMNTIVSLTK